MCSGSLKEPSGQRTHTHTHNKELLGLASVGDVVPNSGELRPQGVGEARQGGKEGKKEGLLFSSPIKGPIMVGKPQFKADGHFTSTVKNQRDGCRCPARYLLFDQARTPPPPSHEMVSPDFKVTLPTSASLI